MRGAVDLSYQISDAEVEGLNEIGVNCIRFLSREGIRAWGARTLDVNSEWRYLNVRRLFNMVEESICKSTQWAVFEPNDRTLWKALRRDVSAFLLTLWRSGALAGDTPKQAFFVKCDEDTNPPEIIDQGKISMVVGIASVKPVEFIIFRISQALPSTSE